MILAALVIGILTAYFFNVRLGVYAAAGSATLLLIAFFVPRYAVPAYAILILGVSALFLIGPRLERHKKNKAKVDWVRKYAARFWRKL